MAYRLRKGEHSGKYRPGQFVSTSYAKRYAHKVAAVETAAVRREREYDEVLDYGEEWEVTAEYGEDR